MRQPLMRTLLLALTAAALGVSSAFLVACGDRNDLIPGGDASSMQSDLDVAQAACSRHNQGAALSAVRRAQSQAGGLPSTVDSKLRRTLGENLSIASESIASGCTTQTTQSTQTTATTPTVTTPTTDTTTTETTPTTQTTTQTTTTPPPTTPSTDTGDSGGTPPGQSQGLKVGHRKHRKHKHGHEGD
jgi:hypothetical protein